MPMEASLTLPAEVPVTVPEPEMIDAARKNLKELIAQRFDKPEGVVSDAFFGTAWAGVCDYAKDRAIDLIVIGTHGRTGLTHVLIGSTAERIVQHAPCPVLTVKNPCTDFVTE